MVPESKATISARAFLQRIPRQATLAQGPVVRRRHLAQPGGAADELRRRLCDGPRRCAAAAVEAMAASAAGAANTADVQVIDDRARVSLVCPISLARIQTPVRGEACSHIQVGPRVRPAGDGMVNG